MNYPSAVTIPSGGMTLSKRAFRDETDEWTDEDEKFARLMFYDWGVPTDPREGWQSILETLFGLDKFIVSFDEYIGHCDEGFLAWQRRHKHAMDLGKSATCHRLKGDSPRKKDGGWDDKKWQYRYRWLVHQRQVLTLDRLHSIEDMCNGEAYHRFFFGGGFETPLRETIARGPMEGRRAHSSQPRQMQRNWYWALDDLLKRCRCNWIMAAFWQPLHGEHVLEQAPEATQGSRYPAPRSQLSIYQSASSSLQPWHGRVPAPDRSQIQVPRQMPLFWQSESLAESKIENESVTFDGKCIKKEPAGWDESDWIQSGL